LAGGAGVVVYLLLWVLTPAGPPGAPGAPPGRLERAPLGPRSPVPGMTIAALLILVGAMAMVTTLTPWDVGAVGFLGVATLVVGIGLVAAAFARGRTARGGLIALGVVLSLGLIAAASEPLENVPSDVGDRTYRPTSAAEVAPMYHGGLGTVTLDLRDVPLAGLDEPIGTRVDIGVGDIVVHVPESADFRLEVEQGLGDVTVRSGEQPPQGDFYPGSGSTPWTDDGRPEFVLTIIAGLGDVEVSRG
ncbi:MAG: hypothetical protein ACLGI3_19810, partial [Actinomycetes bacterium]